MTVFFLEEVYLVAIDQSDGERIEYRLGDGFWANRRKLAYAKKRIQKCLGEGWHLEETKYDVIVGHRQKYLYVLNHEYCLSDGTCFYYSFPPQSNRTKCLYLKIDLEKNPKYAHTAGRIYDANNAGWFIEQYEIVY